MSPSSVAVFNALRPVDSLREWARRYHRNMSNTGTAYNRNWMVLLNDFFFFAQFVTEVSAAAAD